MYAKDPDGIRRKFPDKIRYTKEISGEKLGELARRYFCAPKDASDVLVSPGSLVSVSWMDWPPQEKALRAERCPHCYLDWGQVWRDNWGDSNHLEGCPLKHKKV